VTASPDLLSAFLRALSFVLRFQAAGAAIFAAAFASRLRESLQAIRRLGSIAAGFAILLVCCQYLLEAGRMAGDFTGVVDGSLQRLAMFSTGGASFALRLLGLLLVGTALSGSATPKGASLRGLARKPRVTALAGVLCIAAGFTLTGHTSVHAYRLVLVVALLVHLLAGMFWFGSLLPLCLVAHRESRETAGAVIASFSTAAFWVVPLIAVAGVAITALLVPGLATFAQPYGLILIAKMVLFAVLMALAAANKWRFGPAIVRGGSAATAGFRNVLVAEFGLIAVVLALTAWLTMFYSP
jgi:putative copper resistance protein D